MHWNPEAFDTCFRERYPELARFLHGLTGDRSAGEDVAQEAFTRLWQRGPVQRPDADRWVFRVARNLALDWLKLEARRINRERVEPAVADPPTFDDADVERVRRVVEELPARDREVLLLREFSDLSYAEIAGVVGRNENVVKQDLFRAREHLRRAWHAKHGGV